MTNFREGPMTPLQMLKTVAGICKTNASIDLDSTGQTPKDEFKFVANMIEAYVTEQDKGSEGANQDDQRAIVLESCRLVTTRYDFSRTF